MSLTYALFRNYLIEGPPSYVARVQGLVSISREEIIDNMIDRGSTVTRAEALSVLEEYTAALEDMLRMGFAVNTPLINLVPSIKGTFDAKDAPFDPARHQIHVNVNAGVRLRKVSAEIAVERVQARRAVPEPQDVEDVTSGTLNAEVTPGGLARLTGTRLKYDEADAQQGIFFVDATGTATRVADVVHNKPSALHFQVPSALAAGSYTVEVRAELHGTGEARTGVLPYVVTVAAP